MEGIRTLLLACGTLGALAACGGGGGTTASPTATVASTPTPTPAPTATATAAATANPLALAAAIFNGHSTGTWHNDTFGSSGSVATDIAIDSAAQTVSMKVTLGGNVFGGAAPAPQSFTGKITPTTGGGFTISGTSAFFGPFTITVMPDGKLTVNCPSVPGGHVSTMTVTGTVTDPKSIKLNYSVTLTAGGSATGTVTLAKAS
jgi:hypothetical protein